MIRGYEPYHHQIYTLYMNIGFRRIGKASLIWRVLKFLDFLKLNKAKESFSSFRVASKGGSCGAFYALSAPYQASVFMPLSSPVYRHALQHRRAIQVEAFVREHGLWDIEVRISDVK